MLRRVLAFVLISALLSVNLGRLFIYAGYEANKSYIASTLCENRDKPQLHCNGKCYLMKKIKQAEQKEKDQERESQKNNFQQAIISKITFVKAPEQFIQLQQIAEQRFSLPQSENSIFQPPRS